MPALDDTGRERTMLTALVDALLACAKRDPALIARAALMVSIPTENSPVSLSAAPAAEGLSAA